MCHAVLRRACLPTLCLALCAPHTRALPVLVAEASTQAAQPTQAAPTEYWCPMHPDVRGTAGQKCPRCGMPLVPLPAASWDAYRLDVTLSPHSPTPGNPVHVELTVHDPHTGAVVRDFQETHERLLHLFVVSHDLEYFAHVHPTRGRAGAFEQSITLPRPGVYRLIAEMMPAGAPPQLLQRAVVTSGFQGSVLPNAHLALDVADKAVGGVRVHAEIPQPIAGREQLMTFELADERTGRPVEDLEPYLGAPAHMLVASADLESIMHEHPVLELTSAAGPRLVFQVLFPRVGEYRVWLQFQREGVVRTAVFTVAARARPSIGP